MSAAPALLTHWRSMEVANGQWLTENRNYVTEQREEI